MTTPTNRPVSMIFPDSSLNPVIDARSRKSSFLLLVVGR